MSKHLKTCRNNSCPGCGPESWKAAAKLEYTRGQKYKHQCNFLEEENKELKAQVAHWKGQSDQWQKQLCNMAEIRDSFVKQRDELQKKLLAIETIEILQ